MDQFEKAERLSQKANVSFEEAKEALEKNNWDILDAMVYLERSGKVNGPGNTAYSTKDDNRTESERYTSTGNDSKNFGEVFHNFFEWLGDIIKKGSENYFQIIRVNADPINIPMIIFILSLFFFWFTFPLLIIGLFFGLRYSFRGPDVNRKSVNDFMDKAAETAEGIKDDFKSGYRKDK